MNQTTTPAVSPFIAIIFRLLNYIEIIALIGTALGLALLYASLPGAQEMLMIFLSVLSAVFFLKGYEPRPVPEQKDGEPKLGFIDLLALQIVPKVAWIGCAVATTGILFRILNLKGNGELMMIGCAVLTAALLLVGIFIVSKPERSVGLMPLVYRAAPLCLVGYYLLMSEPG